MKLTPPAPQHPLRRMKFFVEHQDNPRFPHAREEAARLSARMALSKRQKQIRPDNLQKVVEKTQEIVQKLPQDKKLPFVEKMIRKIKKASQRGN